VRKLLISILVSSFSCYTPAPRMCTSAGECGASSSCVAGRCVTNGAVPAITTARRLLYAPVELAYLHRGEAGGTPAIAMLGGSDDAVALLRFSVPLPPEVTVLEAYLLLERARDVDSDPTAVALRAARIVQPWDVRSVSWAHQPHVEDVGAPVTLVPPASGPWVRLDLRELTQRWRRRGGSDFGVAVVAERMSGGPASAGVAVALTPAPGRVDPDALRVDPDALRVDLVGPRLELYVR
jgi:hypothetical protein